MDNGGILACALAGAMAGWGLWLWGYGRGVSKGWDSGYDFCLKKRQIADRKTACVADHYGESEN